MRARGDYKPDALPSSVQIRQSVMAFRTLDAIGRDRYGRCECCWTLNPSRDTARRRGYDVHHINKDRNDASLYNLLILCRRCHRYMDEKPELARVLAICHSVIAAFSS